MKIYLKMPCSHNTSPWQRLRNSRNMYKVVKKIQKFVVNEDCLQFCIVFLVVIVIFLVVIVMYLLLGGDKCNGQKLKQTLCKDYNDGLITGDLCYSICVEESILLTDCYKDSAYDITYRFGDSLIQIQRFTPDSLPSPISLETFHEKVSEFLTQNLGHGYSQDLSDRVMQFTDFNSNGEMDYAESNTLWQLLHVREFFFLMIFHQETTFPQINGTCGSTFAYEYIPSTPLYQKKKDSNPIIQYFFPNYNHWLLPSWEKRANIAIGLLELSSTMTESYNSKFFMCNIKPTTFGVSSDFEAKVVEFDSLVTEHQLIQRLEHKQCFFDSECYYGNGCSMLCNINSRTCSNIPKRHTVSVICDILKDYVLYDCPDDFKFQFESLILQCQNLTSNNLSIPQNVIPEKITAILWDQVKNKPADWLNPRKLLKRTIKGVQLKDI